jgi:ferredoxin
MPRRVHLVGSECLGCGSCEEFCPKAFSAQLNSEGEQLRFPPSDARLNSVEAPCLPFSGVA